jgi:NAD(P)-dependent dehydrogenase (short-subunit alcohol dehydrogenase family)
VLINAAGILTQNLLVDELPVDDFRPNFEINVIGTVNACQAFGALLRARRDAVAPGFALTPMTAAFFENETFTKAATQRVLLERTLEADEIAGAIVFLASPLASAISGVVLPVGGGWTNGKPALPW